ncbi:MarR family transcriptional regulator for hemolysin [Nocardiopsis arvandica]|uniref:MarR family transcriptional regulator for hemolysin n=1 Tax=Nocardiopsis sinuspersici TaxID=501010 RepID=A0A7Z0BH44_9ACTN|nr:MarR family transcriptional regulator [Nocardiopsis sinuspersici]NYH51213.1 MarR family transcriptional regulator for hemolysin [Nocardiopsis sinuspersici]
MPFRSAGPPLGVRLAATAKAVSHAFDEALAATGGSRPSWLVLMSLKARPAANQRELAAAVGIRGATLTQHLNAMEAEGLLTRRRDPGNRRVHLVELTEEGEAAFHRMREVALAFDRRLRAGLDEEDTAHLEQLLERLRDNVADPPDGSATREPQGRAGRNERREAGGSCSTARE